MKVKRIKKLNPKSKLNPKGKLVSEKKFKDTTKSTTKYNTKSSKKIIVPGELDEIKFNNGILIRYNSKKDGLEIVFPETDRHSAKPTEEIRGWLKEDHLKFRWHKVYEFWYAKYTPERAQIVCEKLAKLTDSDFEPKSSKSKK